MKLLARTEHELIEAERSYFHLHGKARARMRERVDFLSRKAALLRDVGQLVQKLGHDRRYGDWRYK